MEYSDTFVYIPREEIRKYGINGSISTHRIPSHSSHRYSHRSDRIMPRHQISTVVQYQRPRRVIKL